MKLNNKGFMMAEVIVVSAIIVLFLGSIYVSYNKLLGTYKERITYYDNTTLYRLVYYRDMLIENNQLADKLNSAKDNIVTIHNDSEKVFLIYRDNKKLNGSELNSYSVNATFKDYLKYLSTAKEFETKHVMVGERCNTRNEDCHYSYLEIYDPSDL